MIPAFGRNGIGSRRGMHGVTLLELMIVVVVVAILASVAYPSYQEHSRKAKRADGKAMLLQTAQALERCYTRFGRYNAAGCDVAASVMSSEGHYQIAVVRTAGTFTLTATPQGPQAGDTNCGALVLTHNGLQGSQGATTDANDCW
ncbi:MAG TPA: type IV pilin protein [Woeseiaceae bacterium]|nr:type IV pilin protein [Woeseiaceae bacterium]